MTTTTAPPAPQYGPLEQRLCAYFWMFKVNYWKDFSQGAVIYGTGIQLQLLLYRQGRAAQDLQSLGATSNAGALMNYFNDMGAVLTSPSFLSSGGLSDTSGVRSALGSALSDCRAAFIGNGTRGETATTAAVNQVARACTAWRKMEWSTVSSTWNQPRFKALRRSAAALLRRAISKDDRWKTLAGNMQTLARLGSGDYSAASAKGTQRVIASVRIEEACNGAWSMT